MHPLTTFPQLLSFGLVAPLLLRLVVGILRIFAGVERYKKDYKWLSVVYIISSVFIIAGFYTQISAIVAILLIKFDYYTERKIAPVSREKMALMILMHIILLSLILTGPGLFALDLPL